MSEPSQERMRAIWRPLAARYEWQLVDDEAQFFAQISAKLDTSSDEALTDKQLEFAIRGAYSALLYKGFRQRQERAAYEIWRAILRIALKDGCSPEEASDFAQETVTRAIAKLGAVRSPESFLTWTLTLLRTVRRDLRNQASRAVGSESQHDDHPQEWPVLDEQLAAVEQRVEMQKLVALVQTKVKNKLERFVLLRYILQGDQPHDIAHDLGIPQYRTRVAKGRALQRLRADPEFMAALKALTETEAGGSNTITGAHDGEA
jgi:RNA polymerase sigma factor (sigma-70 family)